MWTGRGLYRRAQKEARNVFDTLSDRDVVSWGALMSGYIQNGDGMSVLSLAEEMQREHIKPDAHVFSCLLNTCAQSRSLSEGKMVHHQLPQGGIKMDKVLHTMLLHMYAICGDLEEGYRLFLRLEEKKSSLWGVMIARFVNQGNGMLALRLYEEMQRKGIPRSDFIVSSVLKACVALGATNQGKILHDHIIRDNLDSNMFIENALVDMYIKSGNQEDAAKLTRASKNISWGTLIAGYAEYGDSMLIADCLQFMELQGLQPDRLIHTSMLSAFGHAGQVDKVCLYSTSMTGIYGVNRRAEHFNCMADVYARAGYLEEAAQLLASIPNLPDMCSRSSLVNAMRWYGKE